MDESGVREGNDFIAFVWQNELWLRVGIYAVGVWSCSVSVL
jgi:hypothetical protein